MDADIYDSKIFCCSNTPRSEAKKLGIFDMGFALLGLVFSAWLTEMVKHHEEYFRNITENANTTLADFKFLVELEYEDEQNFYLAGMLLWHGWAIALGGTLFYAALKTIQGLLKVWFGVTSVLLVLQIVLTVSFVVMSQRKIVTGALGTMHCLFKWYELWIAIRLVREIRSASAVASDKPAANPPTLVVMSPTPDPDSVYTINGKPTSDSDASRPTSVKSIRNGHILNKENG